MEKTIKIGDKEVLVNNNAGWAFEYREQFGHDIIPTLMPMMAALIDIAKGIIASIDPAAFKKKGKDKVEIGIEDVLKVADSEELMDSLLHMSGLEFVELLNITWALAKTADENIPEPRIWIRRFDAGFPVDEVAPEIFKLIAAGVVSSKNLSRLKTWIPTISSDQPSTSTQSSSEQSKEDSPSET